MMLVIDDSHPAPAGAATGWMPPDVVILD